VIHPIFMAVLRRPDLLFQHAANYAELLKGEVAAAGKSLVLQAAGAAVALVSLLLALGLTGVSVMLGYVHASFHWALVIVPGIAWLLVVVGVVLATRSNVMTKVEDVKDEMAADVRMLRMVKEIDND